MSEKLLYSLCDSGLANRMHAIAGASVIAEQTDRQLQVWWPVNACVGCSFERLFVVPPDLEVYSAPSTFYTPLLDTKTRVKVYNCGVDATETNEWQQVALNDVEDIVAIKSWYVPRFGGAGAPSNHWQSVMATMRRIFQFSDELKSIMLPRLASINKMALDARGNLFGVHIRYGDRIPDHSAWNHQVVRRYAKSDVLSFCAAMDHILRARPDAKFVLASYNPEITTYMLEHYGEDRIYTTPPAPDRSTIAGMMNDAAEMFLLGMHTQFIVGSVYSQYSQVAAEYYGRPLVIAGSETMQDDLHKLLNE